MDGPGAFFLSSGTWSLAGIEAARPVISTASQAAELTNEGGYGGKVLLLRNLTGLWLLQECRRQWAREGANYSYPMLAELAAAEPGLVQVVDANDPVFLAPGDMPGRIRQWCARQGFPIPESVGEVARCVVDALALSYRSVVDDLEMVTGQRPAVVNVVGGGAHHTLLSQLTADATGLPTRCGPAEATALGNGAVQLAALGEFSGIDDIRQAVAASTEMRDYAPRSDGRWDAATERLRTIRSQMRTTR